MRTICDLRSKRPSRSAGKIAQAIDLRRDDKIKHIKMDRLAKIILSCNKKAAQECNP